jgi:hypothetical protein
MNSVLSHVLTFIGGVLAKWFQGILRDHKNDQKALREQVLRPFREQIHNAIPELECEQRVTTIDLRQWDRTVASGRDRGIPDELRLALERLFKEQLPTHDKAWIAATDEVARVMEMADTNFGGKRAGADLPLAPWRKFITSDSPNPELIGWENGPLRLWNRQLEHSKLLPVHGSRDDLLKRIWREGQMRPAIQAYRQARMSSLDTAKRCLILLDSAIDGDWATRISKRLRKIPV